MDANAWGKCTVCGRLATVMVDLNFCRLKPDGTMVESSYRTRLHPTYPFLCDEHRRVLATVGGELAVPPPDAKGNVRIRYPFFYQGEYIICGLTPHATDETRAFSPCAATTRAAPAAPATSSLWPAAATIPLPATAP